ncbi:hypothetical protein MO867_18725 [Microbulbifer sp. OS29]|uniref:Uncharacterized protein n=1 Tax=Microbulbifer okhotskensis TaxID=2926617 RepID=A0A9X2ER86_9GAMM|nr:hypothetical protein [Microbulbifer okhotskensis]MCO1336371.1 hypothetical protein [Microbulbifer okhotskensis]
MPQPSVRPSETYSSLLRSQFDLLPAYRVQQPAHHRLFTEALSIQKSLLSFSWSQLEQQARRCLGIGYAEFRNLQCRADNTFKLQQIDHRMGLEFLFVLRGIAISDSREQFVANLQEKLLQSDTNDRLDRLLVKTEEMLGTEVPESMVEKLRARLAGIETRADIQTSMESLASGEIENINFLDAYLPNKKKPINPGLDSGIDAVSTCLCRGLMALVHAQFNNALKVGGHKSEFAAEDITAVKSVTRGFSDFLQGWQKQIYSALLVGDPKSITNTSILFAGEIERKIPSLAGAAAAIQNVIQSLLQRNSGGLAERLGDIAVDTHFLIRKAIASHVACYRLAASTNGLDTPKDIKNLQKNITSMTFTTRLPNGKNVELAKLNNDLDGEFVEIRGFVKEVSSPPQEGGMLLSHLKLQDPSSDAEANAVVRFSHLPHAGVTKGAFCRLSGIFNKSSSLLSGREAVEVDALSLADLGKTSFDIAFMRLASRWFQPWRSNANLYWSLGAHSSEEGIVDSQGAAELLFTPLIR